MTLKQIKDYAKNEIKSLMQNLDQQNMHILFNQRVRLQDEHEYFNDQEDFESHETVLFTNLMRLKHFQIRKESDIISTKCMNLATLSENIQTTYQPSEKV